MHLNLRKTWKFKTTEFVITPRKKRMERRPRICKDFGHNTCCFVSTNRWRIRTPSVKNLEGVWNGVDAPEMCFDVYSNFGWPRINPATRKILGAVNPKKETSHWPMQIGSRWYTPVDHRSKTVDKGGSRPAPKHNTQKRKEELSDESRITWSPVSVDEFVSRIGFFSFFPQVFFSTFWRIWGIDKKVLQGGMCWGWTPNHHQSGIIFGCFFFFI